MNIFRTKKEPEESGWDALHRQGVMVRSVLIEINKEFERLGLPRRVDVGSAPCDGTGDLMEVGMAKIRDNLRDLK